MRNKYSLDNDLSRYMGLDDDSPSEPTPRRSRNQCPDSILRESFYEGGSIRNRYDAGGGVINQPAPQFQSLPDSSQQEQIGQGIAGGLTTLGAIGIGGYQYKELQAAKAAEAAKAAQTEQAAAAKNPVSNTQSAKKSSPLAIKDVQKTPNQSTSSRTLSESEINPSESDYSSDNLSDSNFGTKNPNSNVLSSKKLKNLNDQKLRNSPVPEDTGLDDWEKYYGNGGQRSGNNIIYDKENSNPLPLSDASLQPGMQHFDAIENNKYVSPQDQSEIQQPFRGDPNVFKNKDKNINDPYENDYNSEYSNDSFFDI